MVLTLFDSAMLRNDPVPAVLKRATAVPIKATQKRPPHTAANAVVVRRGLQRNQCRPR